MRINASMMVTAAATGKIGTYRKNAPRLPRIRTPRRTPTAVVIWRATHFAAARTVPIPRLPLKPLVFCEAGTVNACNINRMRTLRQAPPGVAGPSVVIFVTSCRDEDLTEINPKEEFIV
jgi:hypothetical protein